jgi:hypothetical protein
MYTFPVACGFALSVLCLSNGSLAQPSNAAPSFRHHGGSPMVRQIRQVTAPFRNVENAVAAGYEPAASCVSGPNGGAMGIHYANKRLVEDGELDVMQPEVLLYEPSSGGRMRLVAVEYVTFADSWEAAHGTPATLGGHHFNLVGAPNRAGLPPHWELHVWAWKWNPLGTFADWNPLVACDAYDPLR